MKLDDSIFIKCQCGGCSVLEVNTWPDDKQFNISLWVNHPGERPMSKKERIRWCEQVMKTGKPWADHTIVSQKDAQRIVTFLTKYLTQYGKKNNNRQ